jgi:hypothetical protein
MGCCIPPQAKWLSFAFICFSETGLFNELRAKIEKTDSPLRWCAKRLKRIPLIDSLVIPDGRAAADRESPARRPRRVGFLDSQPDLRSARNDKRPRKSTAFRINRTRISPLARRLLCTDKIQSMGMFVTHISICRKTIRHRHTLLGSKALIIGRGGFGMGRDLHRPTRNVLAPNPPGRPRGLAIPRDRMVFVTLAMPRH